MILIGRGLDPKAGERKRPEGKREGFDKMEKIWMCGFEGTREKKKAR